MITTPLSPFIFIDPPAVSIFKFIPFVPIVDKLFKLQFCAFIFKVDGVNVKSPVGFIIRAPVDELMFYVFMSIGPVIVPPAKGK